MTQLVIAEVFGPTVQGEGASLGRRCSFVRLGRCNLTCVWCDTPYTWDWQGRNGKRYDPALELSKRSVDDVVAQLEQHNTNMVVVTGGEPLVQQQGVAALAYACKQPSRAWRVEVETNGTMSPRACVPNVDRFNVSPKLSNAGMDVRTRIVLPVLQEFVALPAQQVAFKFVVASDADVQEVDDVVLAAGIPAEQVWLMPEGRAADAVTAHTQRVAAAAIDRGYNITTRLHVLLWGDKRGV